MSEYIATVVAFISHHAEWTFPIMFIVAFGESFVFVSLLFPGTAIMVAAGLLVPDATLPLFPLLSGSILGAVLGDAISWHLGRRYGHMLEHRWPFTRHPDLIARGTQFFQRFGLASVFFGRFFGPLRATVPLVAGIAQMPSLSFWLSNVVSALVWAPALLVPGSVAVIVSNQMPTGGPLSIVVGVVIMAGFGSLVWLVNQSWFRNGDAT